MYTIIAPFDSLKHFDTPIKEYTKRLGKNCQIIQISPSKKDTIDEVKKEDTKHILEKLKKEKGYTILLAIGGKQYSTVKFSQYIEKKKHISGNIIFVIGGVYGYTEDLVQAVDDTFSLSLLTFPHNLALLSLLEQIYRIETIESGKNYHF